MDLAGIGPALGNAVTSTSLAVAGMAAFSMAIVPSRTPRALPAYLAFVAGATLVFLAADEGLELHDRIGRWLYHERGIEAPGPINHVDDLIVLGYISIAAAVGAMSLPALLQAPKFLAWMVAAGLLCAAGTAIDALGTPGSWTEVPEEGLEAAGALLFAGVFVREAGRGGLHDVDRDGSMIAAPTA
jgi:hypothetical protein